MGGVPEKRGSRASPRSKNSERGKRGRTKKGETQKRFGPNPLK